MVEKLRINIYIDGNNLYRGAQELGYELDYKKFRVWLQQKYNPEGVYLFIGLISSRTSLYNYLQESRYILIFKQTISVGATVKGNCDAELVLKVTSDFYIKAFDKCIIITGDGDFGCLIEFLRDNESLDRIIAPNKHKCSILIRNKNVEITFLNEHYIKFSNMLSKA